MLELELKNYNNINIISKIQEIELFEHFTDFSQEVSKSIIINGYLNKWIIPNLIENIKNIENKNTNKDKENIDELLKLINEYYPNMDNIMDNIMDNNNNNNNNNNNIRTDIIRTDIIRNLLVHAIKKYSISIPQYSYNDIDYLSKLCSNMVLSQHMDYDEMYRLFYLYIGKNKETEQGFITNICRTVYNKIK